MELRTESRFLWTALATAVPLPVIGHGLGQHWLTVGLVVLLLPVADLLLGKDRSNPTPAQEQGLRHDWRLRAALYAYVPAHVALIVWGAWLVAGGSLSPGQQLGLVLSVGLVTGGQGITIAHELGHRRSVTDRVLARGLLVGVCYGHFFIEHNLGHHARVATRDDPATARLGESLYRFWPRALAGAWRSAWHLERARLARRDEALWSHHNQMLWFVALPLMAAALLQWLWGWPALLFFFGQSAVAVLLLEAVNYVEHYGLVRERLHGGALERVTARHSWNASERLSNALLINLQRHADHHADPTRPYALLRHHDASPQLPTGYPGMLLLAAVPPLWFALMNPRVAMLREPSPGHAERGLAA